MTKNEREALNMYVSENESSNEVETEVINVSEIPAKKKSMAEVAHEARLHGRTDLPTTDITGLEYRDNLGQLRIPVETLPTQGMFYPEGTEIFIRAAKGAEIKHWSTMNDQDLRQVAQTDDIVNYIIEKCVYVSIPGLVGAGWKDLKDVDRFYLLLAVREYTFLHGENELMVPISEGKDIPVTKEMIDFINIPDSIMKYYSPEERCFVFRLNTGRTFNMYIPSLGVSKWLKNYIQLKQESHQGYDEDFILYAALLIRDHRKLTPKVYEDIVSESQSWTTAEWSLVSWIRDQLIAAAETKLKYQDENGAEVEIPLPPFRGGLKAIFTISDPLSILC